MRLNGPFATAVEVSLLKSSRSTIEVGLPSYPEAQYPVLGPPVVVVTYLKESKIFDLLRGGTV